jgi:hypothetical protein
MTLHVLLGRPRRSTSFSEAWEKDTAILFPEKVAEA